MLSPALQLLPRPQLRLSSLIITLVFLLLGNAFSGTKQSNEVASENTIKINSILFDSLSATLRVSWCLDTLSSADREIGITYGLKKDSQTTTPNEPQIIFASAACEDTVIKLHEPIRFDTTYHISLWLRNQNEEWLPPTDSSQATVRTGAFYRQQITFFNPAVTKDTVWIFNGTVALWKDALFAELSVTNDTVEVFKGRIPHGMISIGKPFFFRKADPILPVYIGVHIDRPPEGFSMRDIRIYRDSAGILLVNYQTQIDTANKMVYIKAYDLRQPFLALIDTVVPQVHLVTDTASVVKNSSKDFIDTVTISDNVGNLRWKFMYGKGSDPVLSLHDSSELRDTVGQLSLKIAAATGALSSESGLRSLLLISDGIHFDTINLSRLVVREKSDGKSIANQRWTPIFATANLTHPEPESLITTIVRATEDSTQSLRSYDQRYMRIFRWIPASGDNPADTNNWVEYNKDASNQSPFALTPGRLFWIKTYSNISLQLGAATTLSLKDTFTISLPSHQWTDVGVPFLFDITLKSVLDASGSDADSVHFYRWLMDSLSHRYYLDALFVPGMGDKRDKNYILKQQNRSGYSIYNPYKGDYVLRIPPQPARELVAVPLAKVTREQSQSWNIKIIATTNQSVPLAPLYCGYAQGISKNSYPLQPSFALVRMAVRDQITGKKYGHAIYDAAQIGLHEEIIFSNVSDTAQTITYHLESIGTLPPEFTAQLYSPELGLSQTTGTIKVAAQSSASQWLFVGDAQSRNSLVKKLVASQYDLHVATPMHATVAISYSVPAGASERVTFSLFDVRGRKIWEKRIDSYLSAGNHLVTWNGSDSRHASVSAGTYVLRMNVINQRGKMIRRFCRRITYLPQ